MRCQGALSRRPHAFSRSGHKSFKVLQFFRAPRLWLVKKVEHVPVCNPDEKELSMFKPGTILQDRYRITGTLGKGGMGAVYEATDLRFGSAVALKETLVDGDDLRKACEREAKLLNKLRHAALPVVFD